MPNNEHVHDFVDEDKVWDLVERVTVVEQKTEALTSSLKGELKGFQETFREDFREFRDDIKQMIVGTVSKAEREINDVKSSVDIIEKDIVTHTAEIKSNRYLATTVFGLLIASVVTILVKYLFGGV